MTYKCCYMIIIILNERRVSGFFYVLKIINWECKVITNSQGRAVGEGVQKIILN
jgi:hypothetical protein